MSFEAQEYVEMGQDIYAQVRDGDFTEDERADILLRYQEECATVQAETCESLSELRDAMDTFTESLSMERQDIRKLQTIIGTGSDGYFGPGSFLQFERYKSETGFEGGLEALLELYENLQEDFQNLPREQRIDLQPENGRDGIFGPNTFRYLLENQLISNVSTAEEAYHELIAGDPATLQEVDAMPYSSAEIESTEVLSRENIFDTIEQVFEEENPDLLYQVLESRILSGSEVLRYIEQLQGYIEENSAYEMARSIFCRAGEETERGVMYTVDFRGNNSLYQHITAIDIFGDSPYLLRGSTFIRRYEPEGIFRSFDGGRRLTVSTGDRLTVPSQAELVRIESQIAFLERQGASPDEDRSLGREEIIQTQGREVLTFTRQSTLGQERLNTLIEEGTISPEARSALEYMMTQGHDRFFPVVMDDGSIIFMTNPTYAPDDEPYQGPGDDVGEGVSSQEARAYAEAHGYLLPSRMHTDAARNQAQVRGALHSHHPNTGETEIQRGWTGTHEAMLHDIVLQDGEERFVGGFTKVWAFDEGREPGLNGWYGTSGGPDSQNVRNGSTVQGYSTWHAGEPEYADYSQAAQFVNPIWIDAQGNIHGLDDIQDPIDTPDDEEELVGITHEEADETLSNEEKIQQFIEQADRYPEVLIRELQRSLGFQGRAVDGDFGPISATRALDEYPNAESLEEIFQLQGINTEVDGPLIGENATLEEARDNFRELYGELVGQLTSDLSLPEGFIEAIVRAETTYGKNLQSSTGSKGLMQLTTAPFEDMSLDRHRHRIYAPLFHSLNMEDILHIQVDGQAVGERIPDYIADALLSLNNPTTPLDEFQSAIHILQEHLKGSDAGFDHETNLIVGAVYLAYQTNRHSGDIFRAARDYNGEGGGGNIRYGRNVVNYREEILGENS